jgi:hypothetical protein
VGHPRPVGVVSGRAFTNVLRLAGGGHRDWRSGQAELDWINSISTTP